MLIGLLLILNLSALEDFWAAKNGFSVSANVAPVLAPELCTKNPTSPEVNPAPVKAADCSSPPAGATRKIGFLSHVGIVINFLS